MTTSRNGYQAHQSEDVIFDIPTEIGEDQGEGVDIELVLEEPSIRFQCCRCDTRIAGMMVFIVMTLSLSNLALPLFYGELITGCRRGYLRKEGDLHKTMQQVITIAHILSAISIEGPAFVWLYAQASTSYLKQVAHVLFGLWFNHYTSSVKDAIRCSGGGSVIHSILTIFNVLSYVGSTVLLIRLVLGRLEALEKSSAQNLHAKQLWRALVCLSLLFFTAEVFSISWLFILSVVGSWGTAFLVLRPFLSVAHRRSHQRKATSRSAACQQDSADAAGWVGRYIANDMFADDSLGNSLRVQRGCVLVAGFASNRAHG